MPLSAQDRVVSLGDRVRVMAPKAGYDQLTGRVSETTPDVLSLQLDGSGTEVAVDRSQIQALFLSVATRRNTVRGLMVGAFVGGAAAYLWGPRKPLDYNPSVSSGHTATRNVVSASIAGGALGALIGFYARSDTWVSVSPMRLP